MKRFLLLALCALFALNAEARTLYVNAKRPNNNGNGLSAKKAKKTLQAAINVARKGDTILVLPGSYAPIETKNKKITIKSTKGAKKTKIVATKDKLADLAKHVKKHNSQYDYDYTEYSGNATVLSGFLFNGNGKNAYCECSVTGGTVNFCTFKHFKTESSLAYKSNLFDCVITGNYLVTGSFILDCKVARTKITGNDDDGYNSPYDLACDTTFYNCLIAKNSLKSGFFDGCTLLNCTISGNTVKKNVYIVDGVVYGAQVSYDSKFYNCILWNNYSQRTWHEWNEEDEYVERTDPKRLHNVDEGNVYKNTDKTNKNPKFVSAAKGNYKLKKGSYCIDKGKLTKKQKKQAGKTDLAGKARIKGKAVDRGCYEF